MTNRSMHDALADKERNMLLNSVDRMSKLAKKANRFALNSPIVRNGGETNKYREICKLYFNMCKRLGNSGKHIFYQKGTVADNKITSISQDIEVTITGKIVACDTYFFYVLTVEGNEVTVYKVKIEELLNPFIKKLLALGAVETIDTDAIKNFAKACNSNFIGLTGVYTGRTLNNLHNVVFYKNDSMDNHIKDNYKRFTHLAFSKLR